MSDPDRKPPVEDPSAAARTGSGLFGLDSTPEDADVHILPVPFEATTSYGGGASKAPQAILRASHQLDLFDFDTGRPYESGIVMLEESDEILRLDAMAREALDGDGGEAEILDIVNGASTRLNELVRQATTESLEQGKLVGVLGGDHSTPFGYMAALAERHPGCGILQIDAHHDLREAYEGYTWSHASIMYNVATLLPNVARIVQVGVRDFCEEESEMVAASDRRIICYYDQELRRARYSGVPFDDVAKTIVAQLPDEVYVSFDIDGLDPKLCPNTGTPVPGGLEFDEAVQLLRLIVESGKRIIGFDLSEVSPGDGGGEWDANVGARILYKLIGFALK